jgi:tRNA/rRNA methyltransferase
MAFFVYIIRCNDGSYYTGHTDNLEVRFEQHQQGVYKGYTHDKRPLELMWWQDLPDRTDAFSAEMRIKKWSKAKKEALIAGQLDRLSFLAIPPNESDSREGVSASLDQVPRLQPLVEVYPEPPARQPKGSGRAEDPERATRNSPIIILVRPQLGENIGKAARAMLNFGLTELRLVAPRDGWPNPSAGPAAAGADIVLEQAKVFETLEEAIADCAHVYATTVRKRDQVKPVVSPEEAGQAIHAAEGRSAILFGAERSGLSSDDVAVARTIITVPINPDFGSLNLAQAVILIAYEWSKGQALASPPLVDLDPPAPQKELDGMIAQLDELLEPTGYYYPPERTHVDKRSLRSILTKPGWSAQEVRTLRGVLRSLKRTQ